MNQPLDLSAPTGEQPAEAQSTGRAADYTNRLDAMVEELHQELSGTSLALNDRFTQLDAHMATVKMIISHVFDEADRMEDYRA